MREKKNLVNTELLVADRLERWLPGVVVISALTGFSVLAWYAYNTNGQSARDEDLIIVEAEKTPIKEKPLDPGGMKFPNQDKTIFETFGASPGAPPKVERVLPAPEEPMPQGENGTKTWVNTKLHKNLSERDAAKVESLGQSEEDKKVAAAIDKFASGKGNIETPAEKPKKLEIKEEALAAKEVSKTGSWEEVTRNVAAADESVKKEEPAPKIEAKPAEKPAAKIEAKPEPKAEAPKVVATKTGAYKAQLGAYRTEKEAQDNWNKISKKFSEVEGFSPLVIKADLGDKGIYYRLRVTGFASAAEAKSFCASLSARGQACIPSTD